MLNILELVKKAIIDAHGEFNIKENAYAVTFNDCVVFAYLEEGTLKLDIEPIDKIANIDRDLFPGGNN
jgi:hypothetical protein